MSEGKRNQFEFNSSGNVKGFYVILDFAACCCGGWKKMANIFREPTGVFFLVMNPMGPSNPKKIITK